jgi:hypothetical protein
MSSLDLSSSFWRTLELVLQWFVWGKVVSNEPNDLKFAHQIWWGLMGHASEACVWEMWGGKEHFLPVFLRHKFLKNLAFVTLKMKTFMLF